MYNVEVYGCFAAPRLVSFVFASFFVGDYPIFYLFICIFHFLCAFLVACFLYNVRENTF